MTTSDVSMVVAAAVMSTLAIAGATTSPMIKDRVRKWYQISFLSPRVGELAQLIDPSPADIEALLFKVSRTMFPEYRVPFGEIVMVVEVDGDTATVVWGDCLARLPRRWLRRPEI